MTSPFVIGDLVQCKGGHSPGAEFWQEKPFVYEVRDVRSDHLANIKLEQVGRVNRDGTEFERISLTTIGPLWAYSSDFEHLPVVE